MESKMPDMSPEELEELSLAVFDEILDVVIAGQALQFHRAIKLNYFHIEPNDSADSEQQALIQDGENVFGVVPNTKRLECSCPCCDRAVSAIRFAAHLSGCMGFGRLSSRLANARIASVSKEEIRNDDDDSDWDEKSDRKSSKKKKDRSGRGRGGRKKKGAGGAKEK